MVIEEPRPKRLVPFITYGLILANFIIFIISLILTNSPDFNTLGNASGWWFVPEEMFHGQNLYTLITAAFLHGNWIHIISNMYFLWVFGDDAEDIMGHSTFLVFYLFCAIIASAFFALVIAATAALIGDPSLVSNPCVGASGAIFGVMGAYAIFLPNRTLIIPGFGRVTAKYYILLYAGIEILYTIVYTGDYTAHAAHVGGFLAGILFAYAFKKVFKEKYQIAKTVFLPPGRKRK